MYLYFMKYSCNIYNNSIWFWYDLIRTNPDWRCFQQNYRGVIFCAEIKLLGMGWKFTVIFCGPKETPEAPELDQKSPEESPGQGRTLPPGHALRACGPLRYLLDLFPTPKILINIETSKKNPRWEVPPPQASVATKNQSRPRFGTLPEGEIITEGHLHHPGGLHDEEGVVHPRG
jgi:hypothetical protein